MSTTIKQINGKKVLLFDTSTKHSERCKCKNCRLNITPPKAILLIPLEIKKYFPVFTINPFLSYTFITKLQEAINLKYLEPSFETNLLSINKELQQILKENFSNYFLNCINLLVNRDIFNAVGYYEENIDKLDEFEMFYLSGIINFYLQNIPKSEENMIIAFEKLTGYSIEENIENIENIDYIYNFFLFDLMIISIYSKNYNLFTKLFEYFIKSNSEFTIYTLFLYIFLFFYLYDTYLVIENISIIQENIDIITENLKIQENNNRIISYILYLFICISTYRQEIHNILRNEINSIIKAINPEITDIENYKEVLEKCISLDPENIIYKACIHSIDKNLYKETISTIDFLPINKVISNFIQYTKNLDLILEKLINPDISVNTLKLKELIEDEPNNPFFWLINGLASFANKDFDVANNYFRGTVATDNSFTEARILFSITSFITGNLDKSIKILENSINTYQSYLYDIVLINLSVLQKITGKDNFIESIINELSNYESIELLQHVLKEVKI